MNISAIWCRSIAASLAILLVISAGTVRASEAPKEEGAPQEGIGVLAENAAVMYTDSLIAPQYYKNKLIHHVFYKFALLVHADHWKDVLAGKLRLREALLEELNQKSFTLSGAPTRINIPLLKKHLLAKSRKLYGPESILDIYVMDALPRKM